MKNVYTVQDDKVILHCYQDGVPTDFLIDLEDLELVSSIRGTWFVKQTGKNTRYANASIGGKKVTLHRLLMNPSNRTDIVDHIDRNTLNNTRSNLRIVDKYESNKNTSRNTGYPGVRKYNFGITDRWKAVIRVNDKEIYLGYYDSESEAIQARQVAELQYLNKVYTVE